MTSVRSHHPVVGRRRRNRLNRNQAGEVALQIEAARSRSVGAGSAAAANGGFVSAVVAHRKLPVESTEKIERRLNGDGAVRKARHASVLIGASDVAGRVVLSERGREWRCCAEQGTDAGGLVVGAALQSASPITGSGWDFGAGECAAEQQAGAGRHIRVGAGERLAVGRERRAKSECAEIAAKRDRAREIADVLYEAIRERGRERHAGKWREITEGSEAIRADIGADLVVKRGELNAVIAAIGRGHRPVSGGIDDLRAAASASRRSWGAAIAA